MPHHHHSFPLPNEPCSLGVGCRTERRGRSTVLCPAAWTKRKNQRTRRFRTLNGACKDPVTLGFCGVMVLMCRKGEGCREKVNEMRTYQQCHRRLRFALARPVRTTEASIASHMPRAYGRSTRPSSIAQSSIGKLSREPWPLRPEGRFPGAGRVRSVRLVACDLILPCPGQHGRRALGHSAKGETWR